MSNWWADKLAGRAPSRPAPPPPPQYHQVQPAMTQLPAHLMPGGQSPQQPQAQQGEQMFQIGEVIAPVKKWLGGNTKNGIARAGETHSCPECDSPNYFDRSKVPGAQRMTQHGMVSAAPICMNCGYRGTYYPQQYAERIDVIVDEPEFAG